MTATTSGEFGPHHRTFWPSPVPSESSRFPTRLDCASSSAYVHMTTVPSGLSSMTPGLSGWAWAYMERMSSGIAPVPHERSHLVPAVDRIRRNDQFTELVP